jgi:hypothetical protein
MAMPDQFALRRRSTHGAAPRSLATGFGAPALIRPATVAAGENLSPAVTAASRVHAIAPATLRRRIDRADGARADAAPADAAPADAAPADAAPADAAHGDPGTAAERGSTARRAIQARTPAPRPASRREPVRPLSQTPWIAADRPATEGATLRRSLAVAPPRLSISPAPRRRPGPPVPAVAAKTPASTPAPAPSPAPSTQSSAMAGGAPSALYTAAAALFRSVSPTGLGHPIIDAASAREQDHPMSDEAAIVRRSPAPAVARIGGFDDAPVVRPPLGPSGLAANPHDLDELVDIVVARIEQRVVDELERRGRRGSGGF